MLWVREINVSSDPWHVYVLEYATGLYSVEEINTQVGASQSDCSSDLRTTVPVGGKTPSFAVPTTVTVKVTV